MSLAYLIPVVRNINAQSLPSLVRVWRESSAHCIGIAEAIGQRADRGSDAVYAARAQVSALRSVRGGAV